MGIAIHLYHLYHLYVGDCYPSISSIFWELLGIAIHLCNYDVWNSTNPWQWQEGSWIAPKPGPVSIDPSIDPSIYPYVYRSISYI